MRSDLHTGSILSFFEGLGSAACRFYGDAAYPRPPFASELTQVCPFRGIMCLVKCSYQITHAEAAIAYVPFSVTFSSPLFHRRCGFVKYLWLSNISRTAIQRWKDFWCFWQVIRQAVLAFNAHVGWKAQATEGAAPRRVVSAYHLLIAQL